MKVRNILSVLLCMVLMMVSCDSSIAPVDSTLEVRGAEAKIIFTVGGVTGLVFNTSDIVIEDGWIVRGNLASTYTEHGIKVSGLQPGRGMEGPAVSILRYKRVVADCKKYLHQFCAGYQK